MRRIVSKEKEAKKRKRNQIIVGIILVFVMLSSILGYALQSFLYSGGKVGAEGTGANEQNSITYNGFIFTEQNNYWITNIEGSSFIFRNNPEETSNTVSGNVNKKLSDFEGKKLSIYSENAKAESEIYTNLLQFTKEIENACPEGEKCSENIPTRNCNENFIVIKENSNEEIREDNNCVFIESLESVKATDEFLFRVLGIK